MSADSPPPPSLFDKLPVELLKRVVELVRDQDRATPSLYINCAPRIRASSSAGSDEEEADWEEVEQADVENGRFAFAYKHGIASLSRTSKSMRRLALPHLFETVTARQLAKLFFQFCIAGTASADLIKHVDLCGLDRASLLGAAQALPMLPHFSRLTIDSAASQLIAAKEEREDWSAFDGAAPGVLRLAKQQAAECKMASMALAARCRRVEELTLKHMPVKRVTHVLHTLSQCSIRHLKLPLSVVDAADEAAAGLRDALEGFDLCSLEVATGGIDGRQPPPVSPPFAARFPSLTNLSAPIPPSVPDPIQYLQSFEVYPLTQLTLNVMHGTELPTPPFRLHLPHLRHFTISNADWQDISRLAAAAAESPLLSLTIIYHSWFECYCEVLLPLTIPLPPTLRTLSFLIDAPAPYDYDVDYAAARRQQGINCAITFTPTLAPLTDDNCEEDEEGLGESAKKIAIDEVLEWASRHGKVLCDTRDALGLLELGQALVRVKQLKMLKEV